MLEAAWRKNFYHHNSSFILWCLLRSLPKYTIHCHLAQPSAPLPCQNETSASQPLQIKLWLKGGWVVLSSCFYNSHHVSSRRRSSDIFQNTPNILHSQYDRTGSFWPIDPRLGWYDDKKFRKTNRGIFQPDPTWFRGLMAPSATLWSFSQPSFVHPSSI